MVRPSAPAAVAGGRAAVHGHGLCHHGAVCDVQTGEGQGQWGGAQAAGWRGRCGGRGAAAAAWW